MNFTVASMALVSFHSETTSALDSGLDNGLQTVEDRGNLKFYIKLHYKFQKFNISNDIPGSDLLHMR